MNTATMSFFDTSVGPMAAVPPLMPVAQRLGRPKSKRVFEQGIKALAALAARVAAPDYAKKTDVIPRSLNAFALLASGDAAHLPFVKREAQWAADYSTKGYSTWY
jgi:Family of unknown function (DUF6288)